MDGRILSSEGTHVANVRAQGIFDLVDRKIYDVRDQKIYKLTGELVGHLSASTGDRRLDKFTDKLFREA